MAKKKNKKHKKPGSAGELKPKPGVEVIEDSAEEKSEAEVIEAAEDKKPETEVTDISADEKPEAETTENTADEKPEPEAPENAGEDEPEDGGEDIALKPETVAEIENSDESEVFMRVAKAYEEVKKKRANYKKYGPLAVLITGVVFLTLMFSMDNKATFLIIWVAAVLFTAALMIRAEYNYHKFRYYLGLGDEDAEDDEAGEDGEEGQKDTEKNDGQEENGA